MATRTNKVEVEITAVDEASPKIDKLQKKIDGLEADEARITVTSNIDRLDKQLTDALALMNKLDGDELTVQTRVVGTLEDDLIAARKLLEQLDGKTGTVKLDADTSGFESGAQRAADSTDKLSHSARGANSALANMIGNTSQDLGELGGIVGSLGVGIGQMGEYAADAALEGEALGASLKSMALVAGPIAALSLITLGLNYAMNKGKKEAKEIADATSDYADALFEAQDNAKSLSGAIDEVTKSRVDKFISDLGGDTSDFAASIKLLGISYDDLIQGFSGGDGDLVRALRRYRDLRDETAVLRATMGDDTGIRTWAEQHGRSADAALAEWEALKTLNDEVGKNVDISEQAIANASAAASIREGEATATLLTADAIAKLNTQQQAYIDLLTQRHDEAAEQQRVVDATDNHYDALARLNTEAERVDRARIANKEAAAVEDVRRKYQLLRDDLADKRTLLQLQGQFDDLHDKAVAAWDAAASGSEDAEQAQRDYQIAQIDTTQDVLDYIDALGGVPDRQTTEIVAMLDQGDLAGVEESLTLLTRERQSTVKIRVDLSALPLALRNAWNRGEDIDLIAGPRSLPPVDSGGGTVVNVNMPRGSRGVDVMRTITGQTRRTGRKYGVAQVHYARR